MGPPMRMRCRTRALTARALWSRSGRPGFVERGSYGSLWRASLRRDRPQDADQPIGFRGELAPRPFVGLEPRRAADLLECSRGVDHAVGVEVRRRALQPVCGAAQRLAVALVERAPNP